ncbi:MAG: DUF29 family protein [Alphaproteobacteria bacterium]|jgi:hypothetical protein|nr:DUF29 family protein [Alphaproteobacteria bacterium]
MSMDLYDSDFLLWTQEQAAALHRAGEARVKLPVDWQHVAEEIEDLGRSEKSAVQSFLRLIILHCLKLAFWKTAEPMEHWRTEIDYFRSEIEARLEDSPSLSSRIDLGRAYGAAIRQGERKLTTIGIDPAQLPPECPYVLADLLDMKWWPVNRHGLDSSIA